MGGRGWDSIQITLKIGHLVPMGPNDPFFKGGRIKTKNH